MQIKHVSLSLCLLGAALVWSQPVLNTVQITHDGQAHRGVAVSPDGKMLAWFGAGSALHLHDVAANTDRDIPLPPPPFPQDANHPIFSPDGKSVWFTATTQPGRGLQTLFEIPLSGGQPKKHIEDVDRKICFSPDGKSLAFIRFVPGTGAHLLIAPLNPPKAPPKSSAKKAVTPNETEIHSWPQGARLTAPVYSPDGTEIAIGVGFKGTNIQIVSVKSQDVRQIPTKMMPGAIAWTTSGLFATLRNAPEDPGPDQVCRYVLPSGPWRAVTNDEGGFVRDTLSASSDGSILGAARLTKKQTGLEDLAAWLGDKNAGPRIDPNIVIVRPGK